MKIKFLKSGDYSLHPAWGPVVTIQEGASVTDESFKKVCKGCSTQPIQAMKDLVADGWAEIVEEDAEGEEDEKDDGYAESDVESILNGLIAGKVEAEQKQIIQDWGVLNLDYKVAKNKGHVKMIAELMENIPETEGEEVEEGAEGEGTEETEGEETEGEGNEGTE